MQYRFRLQSKLEDDKEYDQFKQNSNPKDKADDDDGNTEEMENLIAKDTEVNFLRFHP